MQEKGKKGLVAGICLVLLFVLWTVLVLKVDVRPAGEAGTEVGFAAVNTRFHEMTGVNMKLYDITEWLGYIPFLICAGFGLLGLVQLVRGKSLKKVDADIILLGVYYIAVICCYFLFEKLHINDRPVLMDGKAEALEFLARSGDPYIGVALKDLTMRPNSLVAVIVRRGKVIVPFGNDHIEVGDSVVIITCERGLSDLNEVIHK